jgi:hypothetical protein
MSDIDTTRPIELTGINLWTVQSWKRDKTKAGDLKVVVKFACDGYEFEDSILLGGKPNSIRIGREHLAALGVPVFKGNIEDLPIRGKRVWIATHIETREDIATSGPNAGQKMTFKNLRADINLLKMSGYQAEDDVPPGCAAPVAGSGPSIEDDTPF